LRDFYEGEARADLGRWLPRYLPGLPRPPRRIVFKTMTSQWGSLAPDGSVALDLSLVLARPSAFEYVLVHELCHLIRADHSRAFWREVEARWPGWRDERAWFHAHGRRLKACLRALLAGDAAEPR
jgi:predicted metal-dependent hydrolase